MSSIIFDILSTFCTCLPMNNSPVLKINRTTFKILKLLGEGGYSYVYLVELKDGSRYALKKIRCAYGAESIKNAMNEVNSYREFNSPYIVKSIDTSIVEEKDGLKSIYVLLPYFEHGTLQDMITNNVIKGSKIDEKEAIRYFIGVCRGLQVMHRHKLSYSDRSTAQDDLDMEIQRLTRGPNEQANNIRNNNVVQQQQKNSRNKNKKKTPLHDPLETGESDVLLIDSDEDEDEIETDNETLLSNLMDSSNVQDIANALNDSTNRSTISEAIESTEMGEAIPYAHRDIKPANVMISADGIPVLCDLGSCSKARLQIKTRQQALALQDLAAEHCTLPYRAPELLDVSTGAAIDERIDIWSLGCLLYALLYGSSPFERAEAESGASVSLAISSGKYEFPNDDDYSDEIKELIQFCIVVDPKKRPSIEQVMSKALSLS